MKPDNRWSTIDGITITLVDEPYKAEITRHDKYMTDTLRIFVIEDGVFVEDSGFGEGWMDIFATRKEAIQAFHFYVIEQRAKSCS